MIGTFSDKNQQLFYNNRLLSNIKRIKKQLFLLQLAFSIILILKSLLLICSIFYIFIKIIIISIQSLPLNYDQTHPCYLTNCPGLLLPNLRFQILQYDQYLQTSPNLQFDPEQARIHADDQIYMGTSITPDIQNKIKTYIEQAYIFNGYDQIRNIQFIQQKLNILYNGTYFVAMYGGQSNYSAPIFGKNIGISSYSVNGQWWIYWKGANHYQPYYAYYISRQEGNAETYKCQSSTSSPYYNSTTSVFMNVVNAAEMDFQNIQDLTAEIQSFLSDYSPSTSPSVTAVNGTIPFYLCAWNVSDSNYLQRSYRYGLTVVSTPKI